MAHVRSSGLLEPRNKVYYATDDGNHDDDESTLICQPQGV